MSHEDTRLSASRARLALAKRQLDTTLEYAAQRFFVPKNGGRRAREYIASTPIRSVPLESSEYDDEDEAVEMDPCQRQFCAAVLNDIVKVAKGAASRHTRRSHSLRARGRLFFAVDAVIVLRRAAQCMKVHRGARMGADARVHRG
jgi:hypothetical protein